MTEPITIVLLDSGCANPLIHVSECVSCTHPKIRKSSSRRLDDPVGFGTFHASLLTGLGVKGTTPGLRHSQCYQGGVLFQLGALAQVRLYIAQVWEREQVDADAVLRALGWAVAEEAQLLVIPQLNAAAREPRVCAALRVVLQLHRIVVVMSADDWRPELGSYPNLIVVAPSDVARDYDPPACATVLAPCSGVLGLAAIEHDTSDTDALAVQVQSNEDCSRGVTWVSIAACIWLLRRGRSYGRHCCVCVSHWLHGS